MCVYIYIYKDIYIYIAVVPEGALCGDRCRKDGGRRLPVQLVILFVPNPHLY